MRFLVLACLVLGAPAFLPAAEPSPAVLDVMTPDGWSYRAPVVVGTVITMPNGWDCAALVSGRKVDLSCRGRAGDRVLLVLDCTESGRERRQLNVLLGAGRPGDPANLLMECTPPG